MKNVTPYTLHGDTSSLLLNTPHDDHKMMIDGAELNIIHSDMIGRIGTVLVSHRTWPVSASAINTALAKACKRYETTEGHKPGRNITKELREDVVDELSAKAAEVRQVIRLYVVGDAMYVGAVGKLADQVVSYLIRHEAIDTQITNYDTGKLGQFMHEFYNNAVAGADGEFAHMDRGVLVSDTLDTFISATYQLYADDKTKVSLTRDALLRNPELHTEMYKVNTLGLHYEALIDVTLKDTGTISAIKCMGEYEDEDGAHTVYAKSIDTFYRNLTELMSSESEEV